LYGLEKGLSSSRYFIFLIQNHTTMKSAYLSKVQTLFACLNKKRGGGTSCYPFVTPIDARQGL